MSRQFAKQRLSQGYNLVIILPLAGFTMQAKTSFDKIKLLVLFTSFLFVIVAFSSFNPKDPSWFLFAVDASINNLEGAIGAWIASFGYYIFGLAIWFWLCIILFALVANFRHENWQPKSGWAAYFFGGFLITLAVSGLLSLYLSDIKTYLPHGPGGIIGNYITWYSLQLLNSVGTCILLNLILLCGIIYLEPTISSQPKPIKPKKTAINRIKPVLTKTKPIAQSGPVATVVDKLTKYAKPHPSMLNQGSQTKKAEVKTEDEALAKILVNMLLDFNIEGEVVAIMPGPVVTRFEFQPAAGVRASKISAINNDIARSLSKVSVRVVEVIPGKTTIGLEIPNDHREMVTLKEVVESKQFCNSKSPLTVALGKDIAGTPVVANLAKMPHLLVAGTTGSGKSVGLNAMLVSLLYKATPEELRLVLIDPKMLELSVYEGIPHLLTPVITDMHKAETALKWCVAEMERRYALMAALGVRNLDGFNEKIKNSETPWVNPMKVEGDDQPSHLEPMPAIVVLADEFADMMMVVGKQVEQLIARIAQKARAAGIHLILATQRPSVDVITGLIKANIPSRIAFQVSSKIDSRTILDQPGADQLLGHGDMLYLPPGTAIPTRVHGAYVDDEEVHRIVKELAKNPSPGNQIQLDSWQEQSADASDAGADGQDELYSEAVNIVREAKKASISYIQRRLRIGYNRAASIVEAMEENGVISAANHKGQREIIE